MASEIRPANGDLVLSSVGDGTTIRLRKNGVEIGEVASVGKQTLDEDNPISVDGYNITIKSGDGTETTVSVHEHTADEILTLLKTVDSDDSGLNSSTVNGKTVDVSVPADAVFTDTTYSDDEILAKVKNVDGNGSGLDADLIHGMHPFQVIPKDTDLNDLKSKFTIYTNDNTSDVSSMKHKPPVASEIRVWNFSNSSSYFTQCCVGADTTMWIRKYRNGWGAWYKVFNSENSDFENRGEVAKSAKQIYQGQLGMSLDNGDKGYCDAVSIEVPSWATTAHIVMSGHIHRKNTGGWLRALFNVDGSEHSNQMTDDDGQRTYGNSSMSVDVSGSAGSSIDFKVGYHNDGGGDSDACTLVNSFVVFGG